MIKNITKQFTVTGKNFSLLCSHPGFWKYKFFCSCAYVNRDKCHMEWKHDKADNYKFYANPWWHSNLLGHETVATRF